MCCLQIRKQAYDLRYIMEVGAGWERDSCTSLLCPVCKAGGSFPRQVDWVEGGPGEVPMLSTLRCQYKYHPCFTHSSLSTYAPTAGT